MMLCIFHKFGLNPAPEGLETVILAFLYLTLKRMEKTPHQKAAEQPIYSHSYLVTSQFWKTKGLFTSIIYIKYNGTF